jgi:transcriptional regulator with XRE-family HTH domain
MQDTLARKLRVLRAERGLTLREAEQLTSVDKDTLSKIERGLRHPYDVTLSKLARGYGVPVEDLLEEPVPLAQALHEMGPEEYEDLINNLSDVDELRRVAKELKVEWNRLGAHDRVRALSGDEFRDTLGRMEEIENRIAQAKLRAHELREKLEKYEAEGVFDKPVAV